MTKSPCEEVVWDVLPAIRASIAEELVRRGLTQREVSKMLGITPPAVSQYVSKKRGSNIELNENMKVHINRLADDLINRNVEDIVPRICEICRILRDSDFKCKAERCNV
jgi:predicted transcriptional regulator